jgi:hypothetical protein
MSTIMADIYATPVRTRAEKMEIDRIPSSALNRPNICTIYDIDAQDWHQ